VFLFKRLDGKLKYQMHKSRVFAFNAKFVRFVEITVNGNKNGREMEWDYGNNTETGNDLPVHKCRE